MGEGTGGREGGRRVGLRGGGRHHMHYVRKNKGMMFDSKLRETARADSETPVP